MQYRREIDGLRAVAVVPVIFFHAGLDLFSGGFVGVDVFFVISGYLITTLLWEENRDGRFSILEFYERRVRRIMPALAVVLLICIPIAWLWMLPKQFREFSQSIVAVTLFASNIFFWLKTDYFASAAEEKPLLHTWSLAVEEQYYVIFPLLLAVSFPFAKRWLFIGISALLLASLALAEFKWLTNDVGRFFLPQYRVWELLAGSIAAMLLSMFGDRIKADNFFSLVGLVLILCSIFLYNSLTPFPGVYAFAPVLGTVLIILFAAPTNLTGILLGRREFVGIGLISYSAYLWHQPLFAFARVRTLDGSVEPVLLLLIPVSFLLAWLSWKYIERPFRNRSSYSRASVFLAAGAVTAALMVFGLLGHIRIIQPYLPPQTQALAMTIEANEARRLQLVRPGECHFNQRGKHRSLDEFLANWDCGSPRTPKGPLLPIAVIGDSRSGDLAAALRANGLEPMQIGSADCSLVPSLMTTGCRRVFDYARESLREHPEIKAVWLVRRTTPAEVEPHNLQEMIDYWHDGSRQLVYFSSTPKFERFQEVVLNTSRYGLRHTPTKNLTMSDMTTSPAVISLLSENGVNIVDSREIFCSLTNDCGYRLDNGEFLIVDDDHFSEVGARLFGQELLQKQCVIHGSILQTSGVCDWLEKRPEE